MRRGGFGLRMEVVHAMLLSIAIGYRVGGHPIDDSYYASGDNSEYG